MPEDPSPARNLDVTVPVPPHVDPRLAVDFDYLNPPGITEHHDVFESWRALRAGPEIVWTPHHGGHWIVTRGEDIKWVQETSQVFSRREFGVPRGSTPFMPPLTLDPPHDTPYYELLNQGFAKKLVDEVYKPKARALTIELIEKLKPRGKCEFVNDFARVMPVGIYLDIFGLPMSRREEFIEWGRGMARRETRFQYAQKIGAFLAEALKERIASPGDDMLSRIAQWRNNPLCKSEQEVIGMAMMVFMGGLDTPAGMLGFAMRHLARHPEQQRRLREDPAVIPQAVEEFLRRHGLTNTCRLVMSECERKGARFMPGDMVMAPDGLSGMDERLYDNPLIIDFDRKSVTHNTLRTWVGAPVARMEFCVFLEEWFKHMPDVCLDPDHPPVSRGGAHNVMVSLNLVWDV